MPTYRLLALARPETHARELAQSFRQVARIVYREKGQFRRIDNLGVRPLAYRHKLPRERFDEARFVEATFDVAPSGLSEVERLLRNDATMLRFFNLRDRSELAEFRRGLPRRRVKPITGSMIARGQLFNPKVRIELESVLAFSLPLVSKKRVRVGWSLSTYWQTLKVEQVG